MKISLIGMSGSGKSYWSKKLESKGFKRFCCDDLIEEELGRELTALGYSGIQDVAKWMGQPYERQYKKNSKRYLELESEVMQEILAYLEKATDNEDIIVDTTGSVIYMEEDILKRLAEESKLLYFHTPSFVRKHMYEEYMKNPKPVIWGKIFSKQKGENNMESLQRNYPKLLEFRVKKYKEVSEIIFDYHMLRHDSFDVNVLTDIIKTYD